MEAGLESRQPISIPRALFPHANHLFFPLELTIPDSDLKSSTQEKPLHTEEKAGVLQALSSALGLQDSKDNATVS